MIEIDYKSHKTIYQQIIDQIKLLVLKGNLSPGDAIPSVRKLALMLNVTPTTVARAYQDLEREHIIETIRGKGTFIASEVHVGVNPKVLERIGKNLTCELMECKLMGMDKKEILDFVESLYDTLEGGETL